MLVSLLYLTKYLMLCSLLTVSSYPKSSLKRDYRRDELPPPRSRAAADYGSRVIPERRASYRDEYAPRNSGYSDIPRGTSRSSIRRPYVDDGYASRFERPPPSYHDSRPREYESVSGLKRPYSAMVSLVNVELSFSPF